METVENQKIIIVSKELADKRHPYTIINLEALRYARQLLKVSDFKVWTYIAENQNQYTFALSCVAFCRECGISKNTYHTAIQSLIEKGFLVPQKAEKNNTYIFYELPKKETDPESEEDASIQIPPDKISELQKFQF